MSKSESKNDKSANTVVWLTPAECAQRTGLTIRALRVYERYGLVTAKRESNDWRRYGPAELERLNTITVLKAMGMTLAQIRSVIEQDNPSLQRILEIQIDTWRVKKSDAERGRALATAALKRLHTQESLPVDDLCRLIRGFEMSDQLTIAKELVNQELTPEERETVKGWWTKDPQRLADMVALGNEQKAMFDELHVLMTAGASPTAPRVQELVLERTRMMAHYQVFERMLERIAENKVLALKAFSLDAKVMKKLRDHPAQASNGYKVLFRPGLLDFFKAASRAAPWWQPMMAVIEDVRRLMKSNTDPSSAEAQQLADSYQAIHQQYEIGSATTFARITPYMFHIDEDWSAFVGEGTEAQWLFLASAVLENEQATGS